MVINVISPSKKWVEWNDEMSRLIWWIESSEMIKWIYSVIQCYLNCKELRSFNKIAEEPIYFAISLNLLCNFTEFTLQFHWIIIMRVILFYFDTPSSATKIIKIDTITRRRSASIEFSPSRPRNISVATQFFFHYDGEKTSLNYSTETTLPNYSKIIL